MSHLEQKMIDIAQQFTRYPAGRYRTDGHFSGQRFREELLTPALQQGKHVIVRLDGTIGYGSSFLEEAFGGLVRAGFDARDLEKLLTLESEDRTLKSEIAGYISSSH